MEETHTNGEAKSESTDDVVREVETPKDEPVAAAVEAKPVTPDETPKATVTGDAPATLEDLVRREIEANRLSVQRLCTWGLMGVVGLMCYLAWLYQSVQDNFFNPESVAAFVSGTIDDQLPALLGRTQREAVDSAPSQVAAMSKKMQDSLPRVRKAAEKQIEEIYLQLPLLRESLNGSLRGYFNEHRQEMKEFADAHDEKEFVKYFTAHVIDELQHEVRAQLGNGEEFNLRTVQDQSLGQLVMLNERLKALAETSPYYMSRRDIVARRLVAVFGSMLHDSASELNNPQPAE